MQVGGILEGFEMPHRNHENHLCLLKTVGYVKGNFERYKNLVRDGKFICKKCGRVAAREDNLCEPEKL